VPSPITKVSAKARPNNSRSTVRINNRFILYSF
jgi:hypothetical protein